VRRFGSPKVSRFFHTLLQTLTESAQFLSTRIKIRVRFGVNIS